MDIQLKGTVKKVLEEKSGQGKNGPWRKRDFILETAGDFSRKVCITQWGDKIDQANVKEGEKVIVSIDIQSREYKGNWYTDVKAWKIERPDENKAERGGPPKPSEELYDMDEDAPF
ncbi:MAG TPA: DUF3127 domain-containing protein [Balneolaceae bacterium]|nr:DUF3127 domain-containing protein [Balneolaceae bacterium]